jgi:hypothetical protein
MQAEDQAEHLSPEDAQRLQQSLLERIVESAKLCQEIEKQLRQYSGPELETIIQLHRMLILKLSAQVQAAPELLEHVSTLIKPVMDWARIEEKRSDRELARQQHQDRLAAQRAANEKEKSGPANALRDETRKKIERELNLF